MSTYSPPTTLEIHPSLDAFRVPIREYLASTNPPLAGLIVSALIFKPAKSHTANGGGAQRHGEKDRVLLVQRSATDGCPHLWEAPGGGAEPGVDGSPLDALVREVREETGLTVVRVRGLVDAETEWTVKGGAWRKASFEAEVEAHDQTSDIEADTVDVVLDPAEHQDYAWVSREELAGGMTADGRELNITFPTQTDILMKGFDLRERTDLKLEAQ
ncbi:uncharacterized protein E0L32_007358 [Thyridium curvatum]|uniref:Nudix hydrolase domain-containing protein n=1 Tax=Thyridium curvatum TaxID=1093900 RepID=A0A507B5G2_9PEZI|nr:uncharacterized protein E0L32_007358 [Thyridium curvatum]TPX11860.1 hypothetical protein E0L32_007358 [Thyridium curvatum]